MAKKFVACGYPWEQRAINGSRCNQWRITSTSIQHRRQRYKENITERFYRATLCQCGTGCGPVSASVINRYSVETDGRRIQLFWAFFDLSYTLFEENSDISKMRVPYFSLELCLKNELRKLATRQSSQVLPT